MKEEKFKIGDIVKLKSGSCEMTVDVLGKHEARNIVTCVWFAPQTSEIREYSFDENSLEIKS